MNMTDRLSGTLLLFHESSLYFPWGWGRERGGGESSVYISVTALLVVRIKLVLHKVFHDIAFYNANCFVLIDLSGRDLSVTTSYLLFPPAKG